MAMDDEKGEGEPSLPAGKVPFADQTLAVLDEDLAGDMNPRLCQGFAKAAATSRQGELSILRPSRS